VKPQPLIDVLRDISVIRSLDLPQWDLLIRQATAFSLLPKLALRIAAAHLESGIPHCVRPHLTAAATVAAKQRQSVLWEVRRLAKALAGVDAPIVLLKGAAYVIAELPPATGRLFGDIDILVPRNALNQVEAALMLAGWHSSESGEYEQRYYRTWMHELPPMRHIRRGTVVDVHHNLLPDTARTRTSAGPILASARTLANCPSFRVPSPADLIIHSACHLFHEGEWGHALRDLVDLDELIRLFSATPGFWQELFARAAALNLQRPLCYAVSCCENWLGSPVPRVPDIGQFPISFGQSPVTRILSWLFDMGIGSAHHSSSTPWTGIGTFALFVRAHYLRMPFSLLLPHLIHQMSARFRVPANQ
jgi:hypothetical protein